MEIGRYMWNIEEWLEKSWTWPQMWYIWHYIRERGDEQRVSTQCWTLCGSTVGLLESEWRGGKWVSSRGGPGVRLEGKSRGEDAERTRDEWRGAILEKCWAVYLRVIEAEVRRWGNWPPSPCSATAAAAKWVTSRQTAFMSHNHTHIHMHFPVTCCLWWMQWGYNALQQHRRKYVGFSTFGL